MSSRFELRPICCLTLLLLALLLAIDPEAQSAEESISDRLFEPARVDALLLLAGSQRIEGESFEIVIPNLAECFLVPPRDRKSDSKSTALRVIWRDGGRDYASMGNWQPRIRSRHATLTVTVPDIDLLVEPPFLLLLARYRREDSKKQATVECHAFGAKEFWSDVILTHFGLTPGDIRPGVFGLDSDWNPKRPDWNAASMQKFLTKFDEISAKGFTPTLRSGSTGIGYTLETLLDIKENNNPQGDFLGVELKSHRGEDFSKSSSKKMNLFLKEPRWLDGLSHKERIPKYGYVDDNGRTALYSTATSLENAHGLKLIPAEQEVFLAHNGEKVATWEHKILAGRLQEKLKETIFVGAETRGSGRSEEFHFQTALYCREPSARRLADLITTGDAMVEMRMHIKESGAARNHGTAFRIQQNSLPQLYRIVVLCRGVSKQTLADGR